MNLRLPIFGSLLCGLLVSSWAAPSSVSFGPFSERQRSFEFTGQLIAGFQSQSAMEEFVRQSGSPWKIIRQITATHEVVLQVPATSSESESAKRIRQVKGARYAVPNYRVFPARSPNDPGFVFQWHHTKVNSQSAWDVRTGQSSTKIAIVDTGVAKNNPDLSGLLVPGYNALSGLAESSGGITTDSNGHGTEMASIAAGAGDNNLLGCGMGWGLRVMPVKVSEEPDGSSDLATVLAGARWAADNGARIVNCSWTGVASPSVQTTGAYIKSKLGILVFAAGNDGSNLSVIHPDVLVVAATDQYDQLATFSNRGLGIDLCAPGVAISTSSIGGAIVSGDGTSSSTAIVSGIAGLMLSIHPGLKPRILERNILNACDSLDDFATLGRGRINAYKAAKRVVPYVPVYSPPVNGWDPVDIFAINNVGGRVLVGENGSAAETINWLNNGAAYFSLWQRGVGPINEDYMEPLDLTDQAQVLCSAPGGYYYFKLSALNYQKFPNHPAADEDFEVFGIARDGAVGHAFMFKPAYGESRSTATYWPIPLDESAIPQPYLLSPNTYESYALGISPSGEYLCGQVTTRQQFAPDSTGPVIWKKTSNSPLTFELIGIQPPMGYPCDYTYGWWNNVNSSGHAVGHLTCYGLDFPDGSASFPIAYLGGSRYTILGRADEGYYYPTAINESDQIVGNAELAPPYDQEDGVAIWNDGFPEMLTHLLDPAYEGLDVQALSGIDSFGKINNQGQILGSVPFGNRRVAVILKPAFNQGQSGLTVNCTVILDGFVGDATTRPLLLELIRNGEVIEAYPGLVPNANGEVKIRTLETGTFDVRITGPQFLVRRLSGVVIPERGTFNFQADLINGDIDNDNTISTDDYLIFNASFDLGVGDAGYAAAADLTGDDYVGTDDYLVLNKNFDLTGDF